MAKRFGSEVLENCKAVIDPVETLHMHKVPSHVAAPGNEVIEKLAATARSDGSPTIR